MNTILILWRVLPGLAAGGLFGAFLVMVIVVLITKSTDLITPAGIIGVILGIVITSAYALHVGRNQ